MKIFASLPPSENLAVAITVSVTDAEDIVKQTRKGDICAYAMQHAYKVLRLKKRKKKKKTTLCLHGLVFLLLFFFILILFIFGVC